MFNPQGTYDLVYFDAFAPQKQPQLWTEQVFCNIGRALIPGSVLVSYTSKGSVRRALISCQFDVKKVPGPPGKREMIRATRI
jgi:tRNA U34 5-methylaminomethyl-2-thiouridine-forming methyltransferase MnmC